MRARQFRDSTVRRACAWTERSWSVSASGVPTCTAPWFRSSGSRCGSTRPMRERSSVSTSAMTCIALFGSC
eukprot:2197822-Prymnesium_polylepis.1